VFDYVYAGCIALMGIIFCIFHYTGKDEEDRYAREVKTQARVSRQSSQGTKGKKKKGVKKGKKGGKKMKTSVTSSDASSDKAMFGDDDILEEEKDLVT
jgi:hypothetical protein